MEYADRFLGGRVAFTFVEPHPERLLALLSEHDRDTHRIERCPVERVPLEAFDALGRNDILFIDSSHVTKIDSDVNRLEVFWPGGHRSLAEAGKDETEEAYQMRRGAICW